MQYQYAILFANVLKPQLTYFRNTDCSVHLKSRSNQK